MYHKLVEKLIYFAHTHRHCSFSECLS